MTCLRQHKKVKQLIQSSWGKQDGMQKMRASWGLQTPLCTDEWEMEVVRWDLVSLFPTFCPVARKYTLLATELTFYVLDSYTLCPQANCILTWYTFPELEPAVTIGCSSRQKWSEALIAMRKPPSLKKKPHPPPQNPTQKQNKKNPTNINAKWSEFYLYIVERKLAL